MQPQIILITGASSGFGKITAQMLSEQGHIVYGTSRKPSENIGKVRMLVVDVTNSISVRQAVEQIISEQGRMDVLINNAGMGIGVSMYARIVKHDAASGYPSIAAAQSGIYGSLKSSRIMATKKTARTYEVILILRI